MAPMERDGTVVNTLLVALLEPTLKDGDLKLDLEDELIAGCLVAHDGNILRGDVLTPGAS